MYDSNNLIQQSQIDVSSGSGLAKHVTRTYAWMFLGLLLTFGTAVTLIQTGLVALLFTSSIAIFAPIVLQLVLVVVLTARMKKMSVGGARVMFLLYSMLMGISFSTILLAYGYGNAILVFGLACVFFGAMAVAGHMTRVDVSRFRGIVVGGLIAVIALSVLNLFLHMEWLEIGICIFGLALFMGITTYDAKKTKDLYFQFENDSEMLAKASIFSALALYLDFLNIFLYLLRLLGRNK